jgi:4-hydroxy-3-methylbut-2-enyl diphosphate reductase
VLITAHGASEKRLKQARQRGFHLTETTCPLVHFAHDSLKKLISEGSFPVIIGQKNHVEVLGITEDLNEFAVVLNEKDITLMPKRSHYGIIAQTTQPTDRVYGLVNLIRKRFPQSGVQFEDTICRPTKQRQSAAENLARKCSIVIVIGGSNSNNTQELVRTCSRFCNQVHKIQHAGQLNEAWFNKPGVVGITAGTSTPDATINQVEEKINKLTDHHLDLVTT